MTSPLQPFQEPVRHTLVRTGAIALAGGAVVARSWGGLGRWPLATLLVLWVTFGGHWLEVWFLNWLRPRLSVARTVQVAARLGVWFVGGALLGAGMAFTARSWAGVLAVRWPAWWLGGLAFIGLELVVHLLSQLRGRPNFYDGRG
jgi:hypothetical protein